MPPRSQSHTASKWTPPSHYRHHRQLRKSLPHRATSRRSRHHLRQSAHPGDNYAPRRHRPQRAVLRRNLSGSRRLLRSIIHRTDYSFCSQYHRYFYGHRATGSLHCHRPHFDYYGYLRPVLRSGYERQIRTQWNHHLHRRLQCRLHLQFRRRLRGHGTKLVFSFQHILDIALSTCARIRWLYTSCHTTGKRHRHLYLRRLRLQLPGPPQPEPITPPASHP
jgi:hypothetical protein